MHDGDERPHATTTRIVNPLASDIRSRLVNDDTMRRLLVHQLEIDVAAGVVVLRGHVRTEAMAQRVVQVARSMAGVAKVENHLVADDRLVRAAAEAIVSGCLNSHTRLRLSSDHGHLRIGGAFPSVEARDEALRAVAGLPGVVRVTAEEPAGDEPDG